jgi:hypothetical protein
MTKEHGNVLTGDRGNPTHLPQFRGIQQKFEPAGPGPVVVDPRPPVGLLSEKGLDRESFECQFGGLRHSCGKVLVDLTLAEAVYPPEP